MSVSTKRSLAAGDRDIVDAIASGTSVGLIVLDENAAVEAWSPGAEKLFGWSEAEVLGRRNPSVPIDDEPFSRELRRRTLAGESLAGIELTRLRKDGSTIEIALHTVPLKGSQRIILLAEDVTDRKRSHAALADSEQRYRELVNSLDAIVWECDATLTFSFVSKRAEAILGYPVEGWLNDEVWPAKIHPEDGWAKNACLESSQAGRDHELEYRMVAADGRTVWLRDIVRVEVGGDGKPVRMRGVMVDVTKQRNAEAELRVSEESLVAAQRIEVVGRLAGGVAHDFNNLLLAIQGYGELARDDLGERDPAVHSSLTEILRAADRAASLTSQLLAFSRKQLLQPAVVDVNEIIRGSEEMLGRLIGEHLTISTTLAPELPAVSADAAQLEQVFVNLILNARDAMPASGAIELTTAVVHVDGRKPGELGEMPAGSYVCVSVSDTGHGMDEETVPHIFEPFFTTKPAGAGTGLGLATAYGIVKQSGGAMTVETRRGEGSCFRVFLPALAHQADTTRPNREEVVRGTGTILLVEDEDIVRELVTEMLTRAGYTVVAFADPLAALDLLEEVDLLLTDVVMPGMSGRELAERLRKHRPGLKVLYTSGYTSDAVLARGVHNQSADFLQKPFTRVALTQKLAELLDS